jgi:iron complex outermembrane receptor protein
LKTPALALLLLLSPALVLAQQEVDRASTSPTPTNNNQLERVSITRQQTDTDLRRREPVAKQLYGREELDKYGDTQLSDVLKRLPGINVSGGQLRMRGLGGAYTQILVNGEPAPPGFSLDNLNPAQVERLEVSKAPTADQSAQAIAGTLNIILKDAPRVVQKDLRLGVAYASEKPVINAGFTYGDRALGGMGFVIPISVYNWNFKNELDGERLTNAAPTPPLQLRQHVSNEGWDRGHGRGINISPRLNWKLGEDETLTLQGFFVDNRFRNEGANTVTKLPDSDANYTPRTVDETTRNRGTFAANRVNLQYNNRFSEDRRIELRAGAGSGGADFNFDFEGRNGLTPISRITTGKNRNHQATLAGKYSQYAGEAHTITVGSELERRVRDENRTTIENGVELLPGIEGQPFNATITRTAVYGQDEWEINKQWSAYFGVRHEQIKTDSEGSGSIGNSNFQSTSKVTTPLLHLNFKPDPKGRDLVRASLTRSYKAPDVQQLINRPSINTTDPLTQGNTRVTPDRVGNPALQPELATGLDIAYESYLPAGGLVSIGVFHRSITNLIRTDQPRLMAVPWAPTQRWVITQVNLSKASTEGLELEVKGRAGELFPRLFEPTTALSLRASLNIYRSKVDDIPGPDNRLEGQQPWQFNFGADYRMKSLPVSMGFSAQIAPKFNVQQSALQAQTTLPSRSLDAFAAMQVTKQDGVRVSVNGLFQPRQGNRVTFTNLDDFSLSERKPVAWYAVNWEHKF